MVFTPQHSYHISMVFFPQANLFSPEACSSVTHRNGTNSIHYLAALAPYICFRDCPLQIFFFLIYHQLINGRGIDRNINGIGKFLKSKMHRVRKG